MKLKTDEQMAEEAAETVLESTAVRPLAVKPEHFVITDSAYSDLHKQMIKRITGILKPSLFRGFLEYLNDEDQLDTYLQDDESEALVPFRHAYVDILTKHDCEALHQRMPHLMELIQATADQTVHVTEEMISRLDINAETISEWLLQGNEFHALTGITVDGDIHNHGRATTVLNLDAGTIVYKPHDITIDHNAWQLMERFFADVMKMPKVICGRDYGFTEFVENHSAETDEEARIYFYHLGGMSSIVEMLGSADLHHNNILANGTYPVIIDNELLIQPGQIYKAHTLAEDIGYSLLRSSLFPCRRGEIEMSVLFAVDESNRSAPLVNGIRKTVNDYPNEFFQGFQDIYRRILANKDALQEYMCSMKDAQLRHIYRGTRDYSEILNRILLESWIENPDRRKNLQDQLSIALKRSGDDRGEDITASETEALLRGDIPYFYTIAGTKDLYAEGTVVCKDFFQQSCIDNVLARLDHMSETELAFEIALLEKARTRVIKRTQKPAEVPVPIDNTKELSRANMLEKAEEIFLDVFEDRIIAPSGRTCWFGPNYFLESGMNLFSLGLYEGISGIAVFSAALHYLTKREDIKEKTVVVTEELLQRLSIQISGLLEMDQIPPNVEDISMSGGLSGKIFACRLIGRYLNDQRYQELCFKMVQAARKVDLQYEKPDIFHGLAGLLKLLCKYDDLYEMEGAADFCRDLADRLKNAATIPYRGKRIWKTLSASWAISGSGHGQSGIASALYLAAKRLNRTDLLEAANTGFAFEKEMYSPVLNAWPDRRLNDTSKDFLTGYCSGAVGIGLNALELEYEGYEDVLEKAANSTISQPLHYKDFLCCGNSASVEFLLEAGMKKNHPEWVGYARSRMAMVIERAEENDHFNCVNRSCNDVFSPGLFYGVSGIGYELLRMYAYDEIDSILL